jgi:hypothetical protein
MSLHLIVAMKERRVRAVFIQDFQHLYRGARDKSANGITDWLKQLAEDAGVVIVLFATPELGELSHLNIQLHSRAPARFRLGPFKRDDDWIALLRGIATRCHAIDWNPIHQRYERDLHVVTQGLLRPLKQVLSAAAAIVLDGSAGELSPAALSQAHQLVFGTDSSVPNPFRGKSK